jgi:prepilin-type N-terminal cleavage/methylation domain-containing protein
LIYFLLDISKDFKKGFRAVRNRRQSRKIYRHLLSRGFTLLEIMIILAVIGILGAATAPSFASLLDSIKVNQAITNVQNVLQDTQRQAIRTNQVCNVQIPTSNGKGNNGNGNGNGNGKNTITGNCLTSGSPEISNDITLATNMQGSPITNPLPNTSPLEVVDIKFNALGSADFSIQSAVQSPQLPTDPTGKVVAFVDNPSVQKKCVAISSTLGLTRIGIYTGDTTPAGITDKGVCTALDWKQQG